MQEHTFDTIDPKVFGRRLRDVRTARGLTQRDVATDLGIARTTVTRHRTG